MGATTFTSVGTGTTPAAAFTAARNEALYEYGHGGYTGSIAEKAGFVVVQVPAELKTAKAFVAAIEDYSPDQRLPDTYRHEVERAYRVYDDKYGPALCIPLGGDQYLFCGWASE